MELRTSLKLMIGTVLYTGAMLFFTDLLLLVFNAIRNNGFVVLVYNFTGDTFALQIVAYEAVPIAQLEVAAIALVMVFVSYLYGKWYHTTSLQSLSGVEEP